MTVSRLRVLCTVTAIACAALSATNASANVTPSIELQLSDVRLGAHSNATVKVSYDYGGADPVLYPNSIWKESTKNVVVDIPAGLIGNPNAIPVAERCDPVVFATGVCPLSSDIGTVSLKTTLLPTDLSPPTLPGGTYFPIQLGPAQGTRLSLIRSEPEVPTTIGIYVPLPLALGYVRSRIQIAPDTATDLKLRTITIDPIVNTISIGASPNYLRLDNLNMTFLGTLPNGNAFMSNPTRCELWTSTVMAEAYFANTNADADPFGTGSHKYKSGATAELIPDCSNQTALPFPVTGVTTISSRRRDVSPEFDFTITEPGVQASGQVSTTPRKIVTSVPASINIDVTQLGRVCANAQFAADQCPTGTRVGTVAIETPLIAAGLSGDVYLVTNAAGGLPDLGMQIRGAIKFAQRGTNKYVGPRGNMIQTTFDDIPQVGFSKLNVHLFGGTNGLLRTLACPESNKQPEDGAFTYTFTSYAGQTASSTTALKADNCFGIQKFRSFACVYRVLRFQPTYTSRARIKRVHLYIDGKRVATSRRLPFQFRYPMTKVAKGRHKLRLKAVYDDGTSSVKTSSFRRC